MDDTDNASLLTNAAAMLERMRADERALEMEITILQTRHEMMRQVIGDLSGRPRTRRPRAPRVVEEATETTPLPEMELTA